MLIQTGTMSNESMTLPKRLRKTQEQVAYPEGGSKTALILNRLVDEVAGPLDESIATCQRLLDGSGGKLSQEQRKAIEVLAGNTAVTARRLRDYIDLLRLEGGELALRPKTLNLDEIIQQVARGQKVAARTKGLGLVVEPSVRVLPQVVADPIRLSQVLSDLVANAIKFTERGQVTISTELYDRSVAIHVVDTGVGIPVAQLPRLFEDFYQGEDQGKDARGCGLGLTLSRRLIIRMGGDLWATSTVGAGSKFSFTVPRLPEAAGQIRLGTA
jgi:signal transduction histidine kinase